MKKSFIVHNDSLDILDELTNEQIGMLFLAMRAYHREEEIELDTLIKIAFSPFKNQFDRDNEKYQITCERRAKAGSMGGKQKVANASKCKQKVAKVADSVNDSKSDSDNVSDSKKENTSAINRFDEFWNTYDKKVDRSKCEKKFSKLRSDEINKIFDVVHAYVNSNLDPKYRKNPLTWLNGECWNDEIKQSSQFSTTTQSNIKMLQEWNPND